MSINQRAVPVQRSVNSGVLERFCVDFGLVLFNKVAGADSGSAHLSCVGESYAL